MVKGKLKIGDNMFIVRVEHFVTLKAFCIALSEHYYNRSEEFPEKLTKKEAEKILRRRLFFQGIDGELPDGFFDGSFEEGEVFNSIYAKAREFVTEKYPWLGE